MANIYLVRHGETQWNRGARLQGTFDVPLNQRGIRQAQGLARRIEKLRIGRLFTSPLARARQTAEIVNAVSDCPLLVCDEIREIDHGVWSGLTMKAIEQLYPGQLSVWRSEPDRLRLDRSEPLQDVCHRASQFLSSLVKTTLREHVLVVGHGVTNALILCAATGTPIRSMGQFAQPNGSIAVLRTQGREIIALEAFNDRSIA